MSLPIHTHADRGTAIKAVAQEIATLVRTKPNAVLGLATLDILILLPLLATMGGLLIAFYCLGIAGFVFGGVVFVGGVFGNAIAFDGTSHQGMLLGMGLMSACVGSISLLTLIVVWLVNGLVAYGRLHFRLLKPEAAL